MLNKTQVDNLLQLLIDGVDLDIAAASIGVSMALVYTMLDTGRLEEERRTVEAKGKPPKNVEFCYRFYIDLRAAKASAVASVQKALHQHAREEWRAGAWFLEKENPRKYGSQATQDMMRRIEEGLDGGLGELE